MHIQSCQGIGSFFCNEKLSSAIEAFLLVPSLQHNVVHDYISLEKKVECWRQITEFDPFP